MGRIHPGVHDTDRSGSVLLLPVPAGHIQPVSRMIRRCRSGENGTAVSCHIPLERRKIPLGFLNGCRRILTARLHSGAIRYALLLFSIFPVTAFFSIIAVLPVRFVFPGKIVRLRHDHARDLIQLLQKIPCCHLPVSDQKDLKGILEPVLHILQPPADDRGIILSAAFFPLQRLNDVPAPGPGQRHTIPGKEVPRRLVHDNDRLSLRIISGLEQGIRQMAEIRFRSLFLHKRHLLSPDCGCKASCGAGTSQSRCGQKCCHTLPGSQHPMSFV